MGPEDVYKLVETLRKEMESHLDKVEDKADKIYVKVEAFEPVKKIVYGLVGIVLSAVIVALTALVIKA